MRQIVLDTETTGMDPKEGHRLIEIGCVELISRRFTGNNFHVYLNPEREVDVEATQVHGFTWDDLKDKPLFIQVADDFLRYIEGSELLIHNAPFDVGFLNAELQWLNEQLGQQRYGRIEDYCKVFDTLAFARRRHPGQRNSLDALCKRYEVDNSGRTLHGALLDSEILADVYLTMTGGQTNLLLGDEDDELNQSGRDLLSSIRRVDSNRPALKVLQASAAELDAHRAKLELIQGKAGRCFWLELEAAAANPQEGVDVAPTAG
ncbi:DNA polymerase III subunit epsilon [Marinospirillum alkaliphilum]|uniref:DNA polymerase III subunit epsilon n=1 Tax=Marinospirillum alkaliphilum DSM 21637 TaxID=1122209 RepID=A0A1K1WZI6_9GAMM|nr:DNA polymerase III subunit epsilon [Marinospirillum alkaliphilum]SFX42467.1 DNA polymerase-3 subunit epsilon [Marinospirillum alkaliphilum DSM 21637]